MKYVVRVSVVLCALMFGSLTFAEGVHGVFRVVKGSVKVKSAQTGQESRARIGSKVLPGDLIITDKDSRAKVVMVDNNEINVSPESQIKIEKYEFDPGAGKKDVLLNVIYGKVRSKVEQKYDGKTTKFQVKTPSAVAGVRGTDFIAGYSTKSGNSQVVTFEGRVEFGRPGPGGQIINPVSVTPGQMAEIGKGGMPAKLQEVPKESFKQMDSDSKPETAGGPGTGGEAQTSLSQDGGDRKPSSEASDSSAKKDGRSMIQDGDLPASPSSGDNKNFDRPPPQPPSLLPRTPTAVQPCDICKRVIETGKTNLTIKVK